MSNQSFFADKNNHFCWGICRNDGECTSRPRAVLVFSGNKHSLMDCGEDGLPFFYCDAAIEVDRRAGFIVEVQNDQ